MKTAINTILIILILSVVTWQAYTVGFENGTLDEIKVQKERCNISQDYCDPSIKGLEQELSVCFKLNDKYIKLDKKNMVKSLIECETNGRKALSFLEECVEDINICVNIGGAKEEKLRSCINDLDICSEYLTDCILDNSTSIP